MLYPIIIIKQTDFVFLIKILKSFKSTLKIFHSVFRQDFVQRLESHEIFNLFIGQRSSRNFLRKSNFIKVLTLFLVRILAIGNHYRQSLIRVSKWVNLYYLILILTESKLVHSVTNHLLKFPNLSSKLVVAINLISITKP